MAVAGVLEEDVVRLVAGHRATGLEEQVEVAVAVEVGERDAVALLEMPRARGDGDVLEPAAADGLLPTQPVRRGGCSSFLVRIKMRKRVTQRQ